jgi:hypothetical protein
MGLLLRRTTEGSIQASTASYIWAARGLRVENKAAGLSLVVATDLAPTASRTFTLRNIHGVQALDPILEYLDLTGNQKVA